MCLDGDCDRLGQRHAEHFAHDALMAGDLFGARPAVIVPACIDDVGARFDLGPAGDMGHRSTQSAAGDGVGRRAVVEREHALFDAHRLIAGSTAAIVDGVHGDAIGHLAGCRGAARGEAGGVQHHDGAGQDFGYGHLAAELDTVPAARLRAWGANRGHAAAPFCSFFSASIASSLTPIRAQAAISAALSFSASPEPGAGSLPSSAPAATTTGPHRQSRASPVRWS